MINLDALTENGRVHNLSGHDRGLAARTSFGLDQFDVGADQVEIRVPDHIYAISPSFVQGMLSASLQAFNLNRQAFDARYIVVASDLIKRQFERGISAILTNRNLSLS